MREKRIRFCLWRHISWSKGNQFFLHDQHHCVDPRLTDDQTNGEIFRVDLATEMYIILTETYLIEIWRCRERRGAEMTWPSSFSLVAVSSSQSFWSLEIIQIFKRSAQLPCASCCCKWRWQTGMNIMHWVTKSSECFFAGSLWKHTF